MIVFDISKRETFESIERWLEEVNNNVPVNGIPLFIVGNKKDLIESRQVTTEEAQAFAEKHKIYFLETSALDNSDLMIEEVFTRLTRDIIDKKEQEESK